MGHPAMGSLRRDLSVLGINGYVLAQSLEEAFSDPSCYGHHADGDSWGADHLSWYRFIRETLRILCTTIMEWATAMTDYCTT